MVISSFCLDDFWAEFCGVESSLWNVIHSLLLSSLSWANLSSLSLSFLQLLIKLNSVYILLLTWTWGWGYHIHIEKDKEEIKGQDEFSCAERNQKGREKKIMRKRRLVHAQHAWMNIVENKGKTESRGR